MNRATGHAALLRPSNRRWLPISANTDVEEWQDIFAPETNETERLGTSRIRPIRSYIKGANTQANPILCTLTSPQFSSLFNPVQTLVFEDTCQSAATTTENLYDVAADAPLDVYAAAVEQSLESSDTRDALARLSVPAFFMLASRVPIPNDIGPTALERLTPARTMKINNSVPGKDALLRITTGTIYPKLALFYGTGITLTLAGLGWFTLQFIEAGKGAPTFFSHGEALFGMCGMAWLALELIMALRVDASTEN